ncbi:glutamate receptor ionotropic, kainate 1-like [Littorina saxatilis]|uniref:glutamate receptor ionotropic, kainate 1-like n=1 Tax=Littorina saxatilis TaxID=31220 RepID=UPI0038B5840C
MDKKYGAPEEDGTWNGMVGMVKRGEADLAIGPFTITSVRERVVDFTVPYMEDGGGILSRKTDYTPDLMRIFSPFQADIWLATGGMVVVFGLVLFVIMKYDPEHSPPSCMVDQEEGQGLGRVKQRGQLHEDSWNIATSIWTIFGSIMEQGAAKHPRRTSARFVLGCWWVFTILIMSIYTATLAAMLTVTKQPGLIDSIDQVAAATHLTPVTLAGTNWETLFKTAEIGVYKEIGMRMQEGPNVLDVDQALQYVKDGTGVWLYDISQLDYFYRQDCQTLHLAKRVFNANGLGFVLPQQAPFKRAFNRIILKLQEGGFMSMWRKRWWQGEEDCGRSNQGGTSLSQGNQLGTESIGGILLLYGVVVVLAAISMALQRLKATSVCSRITNTSMFHRRQQPPQ